MIFHEVVFPDDVSIGAKVKKVRLFDSVQTVRGHVSRNAVGEDSYAEFDISFGIDNVQKADGVYEFWQARRGGLYAFRFKDWSEFKSCGAAATPSSTDQQMLQLTPTTFQLQKTYSDAGGSYSKMIKKPISGTLTVNDSVSDLSEGANYSVDYTTGIVTLFVVPPGPPTAGFQFHTPVAFKDQSLDAEMLWEDQSSLPSIMLMEVLL
jgi:uncharacterized protein (TIGR02217 family)